jgi:hypothetical protein
MAFIQFLMHVEIVSQIRFLVSRKTKFTLLMGSPSILSKEAWSSTACQSLSMGNVSYAPIHPMTPTSGSKERMSRK